MNELNFISNLVSLFAKAPYQKNQLNESDAEIIFLQESNIHLAITTDSIAEEIKTGLYDSPYLIGWMTVIVNISDLAAVGAKPLGIVVNQTFTEDKKNDKEFLRQLQSGINDALIASGTYLLGGDTNFYSQLQMGATALGIIDGENHLSRKGHKVGDLLYTTGKLGRGNAYAAYKLMNQKMRIDYQPLPKIKESTIIRKYATSCIDTSDGFIFAIDTFIKNKNMGFELTCQLSDILDEEGFSVCNFLQIPPFSLLAGVHGEFELIFTIPKSSEKAFLKNAQKENFKPILLGKVINETVLKYPSNGFSINTQEVVELYCNDYKDYILKILDYGKRIQWR